MTSGRWTLRDFRERPGDFERFERRVTDRDEARFNREQEAGDAMRDELQEHEIAELDRDDEAA